MKNNIIILKNGKRVQLEWSFLVLEYLDEYPGGVHAIQKAMRLHQNEVKLTNMLCYAIIRANIKEPLTYEEVIRLLDIKSVRTILKFVEENSEEFEEYKKKDQTYSTRRKKKKHH